MNAIRRLTALGLLLAGTAAFAGPEVVAGPGADPACFAPWSAETTYLQWEPREGPYRIAIVNGFVGNTWRIQMIKTAKAYAEDPAIKDKIAEFKVVSTGTDAPGPARRHRGLHQPGLRRHRHHRRLARRLRPRHPPRRQERRGHRAVRQRARHRRGDAGQRGPARDGPQVGAVPRRRAQGRRARPAARSSRSAACPATRSTATARSASTRCSTPPAATGRSSRSSATGTTAPPRRSPPTPSPCTASSTASSSRAARPAPCRR